MNCINKIKTSERKFTLEDKKLQQVAKNATIKPKPNKIGSKGNSKENRSC